MALTKEALEAYGEYLIGKPCPLHPHSIMKKGKWDIWCGNKTELGSWCNGDFPSEEFLTNFRKESNANQK